MGTNEKSFEENLNLLEEIVREMEGQELSLQESIKQFERGIGLYRDCKQVIRETENKISILTESLREEELSVE